MKIESMFINKLTDVIRSSCIYLYKDNPYHEILIQMSHVLYPIKMWYNLLDCSILKKCKGTFEQKIKYLKCNKMF